MGAVPGEMAKLAGVFVERQNETSNDEDEGLPSLSKDDIEKLKQDLTQENSPSTPFPSDSEQVTEAKSALTPEENEPKPNPSSPEK
mmetsp:Transcript_1054/g.1946  ORF Transcript_1054/g.1946 Transcript_1054/m.1946 type:complete len:86 (-) Transcript_1054:74-331(-)